jgi:glycosyltransferase involved in cell wall biosynthesis
VDAAVWLADEILPLVRARVPGARLTIVGADPPGVVQGRAGGPVTVTGRVPSIWPYLQSAAVVVAPVRSGGGMRLKVLQAMALGRAVVTTSRGAAGVWNPPEAPTLCVADDAPGIAHHVAALLASPEERSALGERARAAVLAHHRQDQFAQRLLATYDELTASGVAA